MSYQIGDTIKIGKNSKFIDYVGVTSSYEGMDYYYLINKKNEVSYHSQLAETMSKEKIRMLLNEKSIRL